jgi:hypothetical protein
LKWEAELSKRRERRAQRQLSFLSNRIYDETVARKDNQGSVRPVGTVQEGHIVAAYVMGSPYHRERIEEFKPVFVVVIPRAPVREPIHNFS